jgi:hypothetical protein
MALLVDGPLRNVISNSSLTHADSALAALANSSTVSNGAAKILVTCFMAQLYDMEPGGSSQKSTKSVAYQRQLDALPVHTVSRLFAGMA